MNRSIRFFFYGMVLLLASYLALAGHASVGGKKVEKHVVWIIPYDHTGTIAVATGDIIELGTASLPMTYANLEARFRAAKQGRGVEVIGGIAPHREGTKERLYYFKALEPGPATLKVELLNKDKSVRQTWTYNVSVKGR